MTKNLAALRTELMDEFGLSESNNNAGSSSRRVMEYMNKANERFINSRTWAFNQAFYSLNALPDTSVAADFDIADTEMVLTQTDGFGLTGKINVDNDIISFTDNDEGTDTLTVMTAEIDRKHESGEKVTLLYPMPANFAKPSEIRVNGSLYLPADIRNSFEVTEKTFWQHHVVSTTGVYRVWLQFPYNTSTRKIYIKYSKLPVDFTTTDVETYYIDVPNPYFIDFIKYDVMARLYRHIEEEASAQAYERKADMELRKAAAYDSKQHAGTKVPLRTRWDNPSRVLYGGRLTRR